MDWLIFNREMMRRYATNNGGKSYAVISINSTGESLLFSEIADRVGISDRPDFRWLSLRFDDITEDTYNEMMEECPEYVSSHKLKLMNKIDARKIVDFVNDFWGKTDRFIVHCDAGVSRSAGVMAAILKYKTGDDSEVFNSKMYCPNMWCYRLVLNEFYRRELENG